MANLQYYADTDIYIVKQDPANTFMEAVSLLEHYWKIIELPA